MLNKQGSKHTNHMPVFVSCNFFENKSQVQKVMLVGCNWCILIPVCLDVGRCVSNDSRYARNTETGFNQYFNLPHFESQSSKQLPTVGLLASDSLDLDFFLVQNHFCLYGVTSSEFDTEFAISVSFSTIDIQAFGLLGSSTTYSTKNRK